MTSPPYACDAGVIDKPAWRAGQPLCPKDTLNYSRDPANLGRARGQSWRTGIAEVLAGCAQLLRPGGLLVTVTKNTRRAGRLNDLATATVQLADQTGLGICSTSSPCMPRSDMGGWWRGRRSGSSPRPAKPEPEESQLIWSSTKTCSSSPSPHPWAPMAEPPSSAPLPLSVWPTAQQSAASQRTGRYLPESTAHPAKMLPAIARQAIAAYSQPGDLILDPMCGIGTTLVEAIHLGRDAIGIELEARWANLASANLAHAHSHGATGTATVITGDARHLPNLIDPNLAGRSPWCSPHHPMAEASTARSPPAPAEA